MHCLGALPVSESWHLNWEAFKADVGMRDVDMWDVGGWIFFGVDFHVCSPLARILTGR